MSSLPDFRLPCRRWLRHPCWKTRSGRATGGALLSLILLVALSGCVRVPVDPDYAGPQPLPPAIAEKFSYDRYQGLYPEQVRLRKAIYTIRQITIPSNHNVFDFAHNITVDFYDVESETRVPVILILPVWGGPNHIAHAFATYFAERGYAAVLVYRQARYKDIRETGLLNEILHQIILDHKQTLDWIETREDLDAGRIGIFGVSMGGIKAALVASLDRRIKAGVFALTGGDLPYILTRSREEDLVRSRRRVMAEKGYDLERYRRVLDEEIVWDPKDFAPYLDVRRNLLVLAVFDRVVPYATGADLRRRMGGPETLYLFSGHYTSIFFQDFVKYKALQFYRRQFDD